MSLIRWLLIVISCGAIFAWQQWPDKSVHVDFCDVGQGDATLITMGLRSSRDGSLTGRPVNGLLVFIREKSGKPPPGVGITSAGVGKFSATTYLVEEGVKVGLFCWAKGFKVRSSGVMGRG